MPKHENDGYHCIVYAYDGSKGRTGNERIIGPFPTFEDAYDYCCTLPAPINKGWKYVETMEWPFPEEEPVDLSQFLPPQGTTLH